MKVLSLTTAALILALIGSVQPANATYREPVAGYTINGNFCSQGGLLPDSVASCDIVK